MVATWRNLHADEYLVTKVAGIRRSHSACEHDFRNSIPRILTVRDQSAQQARRGSCITVAAQTAARGVSDVVGKCLGRRE